MEMSYDRVWERVISRESDIAEVIHGSALQLPNFSRLSGYPEVIHVDEKPAYPSRASLNWRQIADALTEHSSYADKPQTSGLVANRKQSEVSAESGLSESSVPT